MSNSDIRYGRVDVATMDYAYGFAYGCGCLVSKNAASFRCCVHARGCANALAQEEDYGCYEWDSACADSVEVGSHIDALDGAVIFSTKKEIVFKKISILKKSVVSF